MDGAMDGPAGGDILILAPYGRDAEVIGLVLGEAGLAVRPCADVATVCAIATDEATALVLSEAALLDGGLERLADWLDGQPPWSDLPVLVLTARGRQPAGKGRWSLFQRLGNVTLLGRPLQAEALQSAVRSAQRSRMRQYRSRTHLEDIARAAEVLEERVAERSQALLAEMAERRRAQEALHQAQKMEAIGQLTGGMRMISTMCSRASPAVWPSWTGMCPTGRRARCSRRRTGRSTGGRI